MSEAPILVINSGSSSLKFGLYVEENREDHAILDGLADGIGRSAGKLELKDANGRVVRSESMRFASAAEALERGTRWLAELSSIGPASAAPSSAAAPSASYPLAAPCAIGHRVVHGGPRLVRHQLITPAVLADLRSCVHFAPLHIPASLALIEAAGRAYPKLPQFACFDTAFHSTIPEVAARFALPRALFDEGIRRYGFHGLSYESIVYQLGTGLPRRTVMAHLGNGASLAAVKDGRSVDTTMGLTPTGGIPMATRSGDLDPGVFLYLMRVKKMNADSLEQLLNHESGLAGISGGKSDMRDLESASAAGDGKAQMAIEIFCAAIRNAVAAYAAVLGGLDLLVFAGGIGEHSAPVRKRVCDGLAFLGVALDGSSNQSNDSQISSSASKVPIRIIPSREDQQIARHSRALLGAMHRK
jgi:acetate kinase